MAASLQASSGPSVGRSVGCRSPHPPRTLAQTSAPTQSAFAARFGMGGRRSGLGLVCLNPMLLLWARLLCRSCACTVVFPRSSSLWSRSSASRAPRMFQTPDCCATCCGPTPTRMCRWEGVCRQLMGAELLASSERACRVPPTDPLSCRCTHLPAAFAAQGWGENDRGVSYTFGPDSVTEFLQKHDLDLICRAHQVLLRSGSACCWPRAVWGTDVAWSLQWHGLVSATTHHASLACGWQEGAQTFHVETPCRFAPCLAGGGGGLRIFCAAPAGHNFQRTQLLRRV